eukprot:558084-Amorphochlora_amoeboformis.AAC.1
MALNRLHLVVGFCLSTLGWTILQLVVTPVISRNYFPVYYKKLIDAASGDPTKKEVRKAKKALMVRCYNRLQISVNVRNTLGVGYTCPRILPCGTLRDLVYVLTFHAPIILNCDNARFEQLMAFVYVMNLRFTPSLTPVIGLRYCCLIDETLRKDTLRATSFAWLAATWRITLWPGTRLPFLCLSKKSSCTCIRKFYVTVAAKSLSTRLFRLSTPLMHIRWALIEFKGDTRIITFCTYVFALLFFLCRIVWGNLYAFPLVWLELVNK